MKQFNTILAIALSIFMMAGISYGYDMTESAYSEIGPDSSKSERGLPFPFPPAPETNSAKIVHHQYPMPFIDGKITIPPPADTIVHHQYPMPFIDGKITIPPPADTIKQLGKIRSNEYVVTKEGDPLFTKWLETNKAEQAIISGDENLFKEWIATNTYVTKEGDPLFTKWLETNKVEQTIISGDENLFKEWIATNTYVKIEKDPIFINWISTNTYVKSESDPLFFDWISTNNYVKVEEDPLFFDWLNGENGIYAGLNASVGTYSVAIGSPLAITNTYIGGNSSTIVNPNGWNGSYLGAAEADDRCVAIGDGAKALTWVAVAIGNQAHVSQLHGTNGVPYTYATKWIEVTRVVNNSTKETISATTNSLPSTIHTVDSGMYERCPYPNENWSQRDVQTTVNGDTTTYVIKYQQGITYLIDKGYVSPEEMPLWDRIVSTGQGDINLKNATYGVAVGSRAYVYGHQSCAYGHYSHVTRPLSMAMGAESWVESEGSTSLGYDSDIETNSPLSIAIGLGANVPSGMTNAIVIGARQFDPSCTNKNNLARYDRYGKRPTAKKSNSINLVCHGNGLEDFFVDDLPITKRIGTDVELLGKAKVVGNIDKLANADSETIVGKINERTGLQDENSIVFYSNDGGIKIFTKKYIESLDNENSESAIGDLSEIEINGRKLSEIISKAANNTISEKAATAETEIESASTVKELKTALKNFFNAIK